MKFKAQSSKLKVGVALVLACAGVSAQELYLNFESFSSGDAINTEAAMAAMSRTNGGAVSFQMHATYAPHRIVTGNKPSLLRPVTVAGTSYTNETLSREWEVSADDGVNTNYLQWTFAASRKVSYGLGITLTNWSAGLGNYYNPASLENGSTYSVLSVIDNNPITMQMETNSNIGASIAVPQNVKLWVTCLWDSANGRTLFHFYNRTNMVLIGVSSGATANNATVKDFRLGVIDAHTKTTGTKYRIGEVILFTNGTQFPVWPGNALHMPTNLTPTAVAAALTASSSGDHIILPATNATWTSGVTVSQDSRVLYGLGGTNGTVITADGVFDTFTVSGSFNTISNLQIKGDGTTDEADGFLLTGSHNRISGVYLRELNVAVYAQAPGLVDSCEIDDSWRTARVIFGPSFYDANYPLALDSTNVCVFEDCVMRWTSAKNQTGSQAFISSQVGQAWTVRHSTLVFDRAGADVSPMFDHHGDSSGLSRPGVIAQIYANTITIGASGISGQKFADLRGSRAMVYSNTVTGAQYDSGKGVVMRKDSISGTGSWLVNNTYVWANKDGASGTHDMAVTAEDGLADGVEWFSSAPTPLVQLAYPHPMRGTAVASSGIPARPTQGTPAVSRRFRAHLKSASDPAGPWITRRQLSDVEIEPTNGHKFFQIELSLK